MFDEIEDLNEPLHGTFYPWIYPNSGMAFNIDHVWVIEMYPKGPIASRMHAHSWCRIRHRTARLQGSAEQLRQNAEIVNREDVAIIEALQVVVKSPSHRSGRFAAMDKLHDAC